jgi:protein-S-isoprenylcysteine O-methyltransferase Ste14
MGARMSDRRDTAGVIARPPLIVLAVVVVALLLDKVFPIGVAGAVFGRSARAALGSALIIAAVWPMARAILRFRRSGTPVETWKPTTALAVRGIYKRTRNPIYQAFALFVLGLAFAFGSDWLFLLFPLGALVIHFGVVRREERYLAARFGDDYARYCAKVPRYGWPI